jgi:hypothetical protein
VNEKERAFWILIRQALLAMVAAIERYAEIGKCAPPVTVTLRNSENEDVSIAK